MKTTLLIEIDELPTETLIEFEMQFGEPVILMMTDVHEGSAISPDLLGQTDLCQLLNDLHEIGSDIIADRKANGRRYAA